MAILKSPFFKLSGTVGNLVFKEIEGEQHVHAAPCKRNITSEKVKGTISKFRVIQNLYRALCGTKKVSGSDNLKTLWRRAFPQRKPLNSFFTKENFGVVNSSEDYYNVRISPTENCFAFPGCELRYENEELDLVIPKMETTLGLNPDTENYIEAAGFISLKESTLPDGKNCLSNLLSKMQAVKFNEELHFNLDFSSNLKFSNYTKVEIFLILITLTEKNNPVRTSVKKIFELSLS